MNTDRVLIGQKTPFRGHHHILRMPWELIVTEVPLRDNLRELSANMGW
jgi:hypothetical protein